MTLNQKQFEKLTKVVAIGARLSEIERFEGYVPSSQLSTRKRSLKKQLAELIGEDTEERTVNIRIEIPEGEKKVEKEEKKSFTLKLADLLKGKFNKVEDDDDEVVVALRKLIPEELHSVYGKIVREL